jgi:hypothetical protein
MQDVAIAGRGQQNITAHWRGEHMQAQPIRIPRMLPAFAACAAIGLAVGVCRPANAGIPTYQCPPTVAHRSTAVGAWIDVPHGSYPNPRLAYDQLTCPSGAPVGFAYEGGDGTFTNANVQIS